MLPAIEIVDSRIAGWDISIVDTVADNASSGLFVLGTTPRRLADVDLRLCGMVLEHAGEPVSVGAGAACLGNPLHALAVAGRHLGPRRRPAARRGRGALRGARPDGAGDARRGVRGTDLRAGLGADLLLVRGAVSVSSDRVCEPRSRERRWHGVTSAWR